MGIFCSSQPSRWIASIALLALFCCQNTAKAQTFNYKTTEASEARTANSIFVHGYPDSLTVWCNEWTDIVSSPSSWGNDFKLKSNNTFVKFSVDNYFPTTVYGASFNYTYRLTYQIYGYTDPTDTVTVYTTNSDTLTISYNNNSYNSPYQDLHLKKYSGFYKALIVITGIYEDSAGYIIPANFSQVWKQNFQVEGSILTQRFDKDKYGPGFPLVVNSGTSSPNVLDLYWDFTSGPYAPVQTTPINYELEWTFVDDYSVDPMSGAISAKSASDIHYDFSHNATRVWLQNNKYQIPIVYPSGYVIYRIRPVRPDSVLFQYPVYGDWSLASPSGTVASAISNSAAFQISTSYLRDYFNWQYNISFAEGGRYKHVASFYDGLLKTRQSITRFNTFLTQLIATTNIYDFEGHLAIRTLPAPTSSSGFEYLDGVALNSATGITYTAADFDTGFASCPLTDSLSPMFFRSLANIYYSNQNPDTAGCQQFVPDAEGYPLIHTEFQAGYNDRINKQGGAGKHLQLHTGHILQNYYVGASQASLNSLFGVNVGWQSYYNATLTSDPNNQLSMSVTDYEGRPVMSCMIGPGRDTSSGYALVSADVPSAFSLRQDLLHNTPQQIIGHKKIADYDYFNQANGDDSLQYFYSYAPFPVCPSQALSVKAHFHFDVTDQCGNIVSSQDSVLGVNGIVSGPVTPFAGSVNTFFARVAPYHVHKELTVDASDISAALDSFLNAPPDCFLSEPYFIRKAVEARQFPCPSTYTTPCQQKKWELMQELFPSAKYGQYTIVQDTLTVVGATVVGTSNSVFTAIFDPVTDLWHYRYQDTCTIPSLPDTMVIGGTTFTRLRTMRADSFVAIYNMAIGLHDYRIAEYLLPLHPEYCELRRCFDDTFKTQVLAIPTASVADNLHLLYLDSIATHDPALPMMTAAGFASPFDSLTKYPGGNLDLDYMAMRTAYCGCGDSVMGKQCVDMFEYNLTNRILVNDKVKEAYFKTIPSLYFQNRQRFLDKINHQGGDTCAHCAIARMTLTPAPVFPPDTFSAAGIIPIDTPMVDSSFLAAINITPLTVVAGAFTLDSLDSTMQALYDSSLALYHYQDSSLCYGQADSILARLANCFEGDATKMNAMHALLDTFCVHHVKLTPAVVESALSAIGIVPGDLCNPYILNYLSFDDTSSQSAFNCRPDTFYRSISSFMTNTVVVTSLVADSTYQSYILDTMHSMFEKEISAILGHNVDVNMFGDYDPANMTYVLYVYNDPILLSANTDTVRIFLRSPLCGDMFQAYSSDSVVVIATCINEYDQPSGTGFVNEFSFLATVSAYSASLAVSCTMLGWADSVQTMYDKHNLISECIPCTQIKELYTQFDSVRRSYNVHSVNHPYYEQMLRSYMNYSLRKSFTDDQYENFIESCALADSMRINRNLGYSLFTFADSTDMSLFIDSLNRIDTEFSFDDAYRLRAPGTVIVLVDINHVDPWLYWKYKNFMTWYSGSYSSRDINTTLTIAALGFLSLEPSTVYNANDSLLYDTTRIKMAAPVSLDVWIHDHFEPRDFYSLDTLVPVEPYEISRAVHAVQRNVYENGVPGAVFSSYFQSTINKDYYKPEKQDYLHFVYSFQHLEPYQVLDSIQSQYLLTGIPSYGGNQASYTQPFDPNTVTNLYISNPGMANHYFDTLVMVLDSVASLNTVNPGFIFFDTNKVVVITTPDSPLIAYRCSDGTYWYRYFTGGDTMYNVYVHVPDYIPRHLHKYYQVVNIVPALGDSASRFFTLDLQRAGDPTIIKAQGLTSFVIGRNTRLDNVLLGNPITGGVGYPITDTFNNCERNRLTAATHQGVNDYHNYIDSAKSAITANFRQYMMDSVHEELILSYINNEFAYTLYQYDRAGNLITTVPPEGVHPVRVNSPGVIDSSRAAHDETAVVAYTKANNYQYNTLNEVTQQTTINGGTTIYIYDDAGRLVLSQNAKQRVPAPPLGTPPPQPMTYNIYDQQNRLIETGQTTIPDGLVSPVGSGGSVIGGGTGTAPTGFPYYDVVMHILTHDRTDVVMTIYDTVAANLQSIPGFCAQANLRKRVATVKYFDTLLATDSGYADYVHATHYSYDLQGNVNYLVQDFPELDVIKQRYKRVDYDYDVISGKVNMLSYNRGFADQYYQRYSYDADNKIQKVETSNDGYIWSRDAEYTYYQHGPLARVDIGDLRVQGMDYAYTINGWLKVVNGDTLNATLDMGRDGTPTGPINAPDKVAYTLDYFNNDYRPITAQPLQHTPQGRNLYNGNIVGQTVAIDTFRRLHKQYVYDQMNRIKSADYFDIDAVANTIAGLNDFHNSYKYDLDGNLQALVRYGNNTGTGAAIMDSLHYFYPSGSDRLADVHDSAINSYTNDLPEYHTATPDRYAYDAIGNVIVDLPNAQDTIEWNLYNKVTRTVNNADTSSLKFTYDAMGNRIAKHFSKTTPTGKKQRDDYYVHDAQGNILAIYHGRQKFDVSDILLERDYSLSEHNIYGSTRLGVKEYFPMQICGSWDYTFSTFDTNIYIRWPWYSLDYQDAIVSDSSIHYGNAFADSQYAQHITGQKQYEITDHLGDVVGTISDQRTVNTYAPVTGGLTVDSPANIETYKALTNAAYDYYPFGQMMPGRFVKDTSTQTFTATVVKSLPHYDTLVHGYLDTVATNIQRNWYNSSCAPCGIRWGNDSAAPPPYHASFVPEYFDSISFTSTGVCVTQFYPDSLTPYLPTTYGFNPSNPSFALFPMHGLTPGKQTYVRVATSYLWSNTTYFPSNTLLRLSIMPSESAASMYFYDWISTPSTNADVYADFVPDDTIAYLTITAFPQGLFGYGRQKSAVEIIDSITTWDSSSVWVPPVVDTTYRLVNVVSNISTEDHYHYGYNGKYKDNEWAGVGNHYDYGARHYDPRIARFLSVDPVINCRESRYAYAGNSPIEAIDYDGRFRLPAWMREKFPEFCKWLNDPNGAVKMFDNPEIKRVCLKYTGATLPELQSYFNDNDGAELIAILDGKNFHANAEQADPLQVHWDYFRLFESGSDQQRLAAMTIFFSLFAHEVCHLYRQSHPNSSAPPVHGDDTEENPGVDEELSGKGPRGDGPNVDVNGDRVTKPGGIFDGASTTDDVIADVMKKLGGKTDTRYIHLPRREEKKKEKKNGHNGTGSTTTTGKGSGGSESRAPAQTKKEAKKENRKAIRR